LESKNKQEEEEENRKENRKQQKKENKQKRNQEKLFPTANNRTENLPSRVASQLLYCDIFSMYMRHFVQDDPRPLKHVIQDIMTTSSSLPKKCTIGH
jgi:hypothetical protein